MTNYNLRSALEKGGSKCPELDMKKIRLELMYARVAQLSKATQENPIMATAKSISDFHNEIFRKYGAIDGLGPLPVFGGDIPIFGNLPGWKWCSSPACKP